MTTKFDPHLYEARITAIEIIVKAIALSMPTDFATYYADVKESALANLLANADAPDKMRNHLESVLAEYEVFLQIDLKDR